MTFTPDLVRELRRQHEAAWTKRCPCGNLMDDNDQVCAACESEQHRDAQIVALHRTLNEHLTDANRGILCALSDLAQLMSSEVFDIDLAEGTDGADMRHELEAAARHLRNAIRIDQAHGATA